MDPAEEEFHRFARYLEQVLDTDTEDDDDDDAVAYGGSDDDGGDDDGGDYDNNDGEGDDDDNDGEHHHHYQYHHHHDGELGIGVDLILNDTFIGVVQLNEVVSYEELATQISALYCEYSKQIPVSSPTIYYPVLGHSVTYWKVGGTVMNPMEMDFRHFRAELSYVHLEDV